MPKSTYSHLALPVHLKQSLIKTGQQIQIARKRRRFSLKNMSERMMVSIDTVQRLERGEPTISIGIFISALFVLGISNRFLDLTDPARDNVGLKEDINNLPKKIASIKSNVLDF